MPSITTKNMSFEKALRIFRKKVENSGMKDKLREKEYYEKPTAKRRRKISTPSYTQVINPLYTTSINKWKNYNNIINPMPNLEKWVRKFNYYFF